MVRSVARLCFFLRQSLRLCLPVRLGALVDTTFSLRSADEPRLEKARAFGDGEPAYRRRLGLFHLMLPEEENPQAGENPEADLYVSSMLWFIFKK